MAAKKARKGGNLINENQRRQLEAIGDWPVAQTPPPAKPKAPAKKKRKK